MVIKNYIDSKLFDDLDINKFGSLKKSERKILLSIIMRKKDLELTYHIKFDYMLVSGVLMSVLQELPEFIFSFDNKTKIYGYISDLKVGMEIHLKKEEIIFTSNENEFNNFERILKIQDINDN